MEVDLILSHDAVFTLLKGEFEESFPGKTRGGDVRDGLSALGGGAFSHHFGVNSLLLKTRLAPYVVNHGEQQVSVFHPAELPCRTQDLGVELGRIEGLYRQGSGVGRLLAFEVARIGQNLQIRRDR